MGGLDKLASIAVSVFRGCSSAAAANSNAPRVLRTHAAPRNLAIGNRAGSGVCANDCCVARCFALDCAKLELGAACKTREVQRVLLAVISALAHRL